MYLRNVKFADLCRILDFVYIGEVTVSQNDLESFISTACDLKVRGLHIPNPASYLSPETGLMEGQDVVTSVEEKESSMEEQIGEIREQTGEIWEQTGEQRERTSGSIEEQVMGFNEWLGNNNPPHDAPPLEFTCQECHEVLKSTKLLKRHRQKHAGVSFPCDSCENSFSRKDNLNKHKNKFH